MFQPRLNNKRLADLCHRLAISAESGIDIRRTWEREADNATGSRAKAYRLVQQGVSRGDTLADALAQTGRLFPPLFHEMIQVGEQTGCLAEVLHKLSHHYQHKHDMSRALRVQLTWPMLQLGAAVLIVGIMIGVLGALDLRLPSGKPIDILGMGVAGPQALLVYIQLVIGAVIVVAGLVFAWRQGVLWIAPVERIVMVTPSIGPALQKICLARLTWALQLTLNVEMDLRRLVPLVLRATGSDYYARWSKPITKLVAAGSPLSEAFATAQIFPHHFLDALQVAEESGQFVESMKRLADQYEQESEQAMQTLNTIFGFLLGTAVLVLIGAVVVRLVQVVYIGAIYDALEL